MRILVLTPLYPPATGGAATYFGHIVPLLSQEDEIAQLIVLTEKLPGETAVQDQGATTILRLLPTRVSTAHPTWFRHAVTYIWTQIWFVLCLHRLVRRYRIDLIHFHTRYKGPLFYWALSSCNLPILADLRDKMTDPAKIENVATRLVCCGQGVYQFAVKGGFPGERCDLVPVAFQPPDALSSGAVTAVQQQYHLPIRPYILFAGEITYNKGIYELLFAFKAWQINHPHVQLVIAGTNREGDKFTQQIKGKNQITYLGRLPHQDILALIQGAELLLLPSRSEGLPRVILEAIALNTKVICPPNVPEFEKYLPANTLSTVDKTSLIQLLEEVWKQEAMPQYPLPQHSLTHVVQSIMKVYQKALNQGNTFN